jgi:glycosyltransferase involved in cell wall biosynthesis
MRYYYKRLVSLLTIKNYDLIWIEYEIFPYLPAFAERMLNIIGKEYIVDYDDAVFHHYDMSSNPLVRKVLSKKITTVMQKSSCVIAGNNYLIEQAKASGAKHVEWVPTVVDKFRYRAEFKQEHKTKVIGWIGSPSTQTYIVDIRKALNTISENHSIRLLLVGANKDIIEEFPDIDVDVVSWSESTEAEYIRQMDIGIMPLVNGPWEKGKCGYKLIQYMASGIPVIASPVGVNIDIIKNSNSGYLADTIDQWTASLEGLLSSSKQREDFGSFGRASVEDTYSLQVQAPILANILNSIHKSKIV